MSLIRSIPRHGFIRAERTAVALIHGGIQYDEDRFAVFAETRVHHEARSFADPATPKRARILLDELATTPCSFSPCAVDRPFALYGAGSLGRLARDFLQIVGHDFVLVLDRKAYEMTQDTAWTGMQLRHPNEVDEKTRTAVRVAVSIVTAPYVPLERALVQHGFMDVVPFYDLAESFRHLHPLSNGWFAPPMSADDHEKAAEVLTRWHDDVSRAHHLQFLAWRRLREEWTFATAPISTSLRFFIPEIAGLFRDNEILLDGGAHHGGVSESFLRHTKGRFARIIAVEPDSANRALLADRLHSLLPDDPRVSVLDCALGESNGEALFHDGLGYASQLSETGKRSVAVRQLDALDLAPTFVKLHLEGAELAALNGARETLLSSRPLIAATVYHNAEGIWRTPLWLMETLPNYRWLFRADCWCGTGAIVYGIPNKRLG